MKEFTENLSIEEMPLEEKPSFYDSISDYALKSVMDGKYNVYDNLLRFIEAAEVSVTVSDTVVTGPPPLGIAGGTGSNTYFFNTDGGKVFIDVITIDAPNAIGAVNYLTDIRYDDEKLTISIEDPFAPISRTGYTFRYKVLVFELLSKN